MPRGGSQPGERRGGRKKGVKNKRTRAFVEAVKASGLMPLDFMLSIMRDEDQPMERRMEMAKAAAPHLHPRLTTTKLQGDRNAPLFDLTSLSDKELQFLRRTVLKAQEVSGVTEDR